MGKVVPSRIMEVSRQVQFGELFVVDVESATVRVGDQAGAGATAGMCTGEGPCQGRERTL